MGARQAVAIADRQQPAGPFTASTDLVVVPVVVEDRKGASVRTLRQEDFTLTEDGKPVAIETFVAPAAAAEGGMGADGRFVVVALDNITTPAEIAWRVKDIANYFVDRMGPADDLSVITLANGRASSGGGQEAARAAIRRFGSHDLHRPNARGGGGRGPSVAGIAHRADGEVAASAQGAGHHRRQLHVQPQ